LKDKDFLINHENSDKIIDIAAYFLAKLTLDAIKDLFFSAHEIKKWLK